MNKEMDEMLLLSNKNLTCILVFLQLTSSDLHLICLLLSMADTIFLIYLETHNMISVFIYVIFVGRRWYWYK